MVKSELPPAPKPARLSTDHQIALLLAAVTLGLLLREVVTDLLPGDAGEFHFAAWRWGLAHPTGYPLYLLLGGVWQRVWALFGVPPAWSLNALSAVFTAAAAGLFYPLLRRWLPGPLLPARIAAVLGVAFLIANPTLRTQSVQAEVYSLHLLLLIGILLAANKLAQPTDERATRLCAQTPQPGVSPAHPLILLAFLLGLSLAHHATTLLLLPPLAVYLTLARHDWWRPLRAWLWAGAAFVLPLLLYLYVPLRSGPDASPWYHQRLGEGVLALYTGGWQSFVDFVTGRSISVGFYTAGEAWANLPIAGLLWLRNFEWTGLLLIALGLFVLVRLRNWPLLALTVSYVTLHQVFNLFYAIGDIFVYYIPLYLIGCVWVAFGGAGIGTAFRFAPAGSQAGTPAAQTDEPDGRGEKVTQEPLHPLTRSPAHSLIPQWSLPLLLLLFVLPVQLWRQYDSSNNSLTAALRAESAAARTIWEEILAAQPPANAILVSNDRNEIVPLFYLQTVEDRGAGMTGLFPLIAPDARFTDIGATVQTALDAGGEQPVYLIKPMPGLEARFALAPAAAPLMQVAGSAAAAPPDQSLDIDYGPLRLLGYDLIREGEQVEVALHWQVSEPLASDYTTTVQLFDAAGEKIGQDDRQPGGVFYSTSLWKPGEVLLDRHTLTVPAGREPVRLLIGMYSGPDAALLAPALEVALRE